MSNRPLHMIQEGCDAGIPPGKITDESVIARPVGKQEFTSYRCSKRDFTSGGHEATRALRRSPNIDWDDHLTGKGDLLLGLRSANSPREREPEAYRITIRPR